MLFFISIVNFKNSFAQQFLTKIDGWNAYVHLPDEYNDSIFKSYPLILFVPGLGEVGTNASKLLINGPSAFINLGNTMQFMVNGKLEKPIVISIQPIDPWTPHPTVINRKIDSIVARWRCDLQRINTTGLSMGGQTWHNYVNYGSTAYIDRIASIVAMSAPQPDNGISNMKRFVLSGSKWWGFEGNSDPRDMDKIRDTMNAYVPASARYNLYIGGHCCWNTWYNPAWNENGESIYTWMLKQKRPAGSNVEPQSNAGKDSALATVVTSYYLTGSGNDPDGNAISFNWRKLSGPVSGVISNSTASQTWVTGLSMGTYKFELAVTDILGALALDTVIINDGNLVLPVKLTEFKAIEKAGYNALYWKTSMELNSHHFVVEKSTGGNDFILIGKVDAAGNSNREVNYQFRDINAPAGKNYYRLRVVDIDEMSAYSKVVSLDCKENESFSVEQVSFLNSKLQATVYSGSNKVINFALADPMGRIIFNSPVTLKAGANPLQLFIPSKKGLYYARFTEKEKITKAIINQ